ncbi:ester cyclase [Gordonia jacobaea]|uniref:ester cyclase n=1 Tax=Gordonia jacobaea TaxID=122202 RepID=UPI003D70A12D
MASSPRPQSIVGLWATGDVAYLYRADSRSFFDHTLQQGRQQGLPGIEQVSRQFRAAVPDFHCTVADVLVSGDCVSVRQVYTGHFTGTYDGVRGHGQPIQFNAFDIQQVGRSQIGADWHLEDNLTFLTQIGAR